MLPSRHCFPVTVCLAGYGTSANSYNNSATSCSGCSDGFYQEGASTSCLTCGTTDAFVYPGKVDAVGPVSATTKPPSAAGVAGAVSKDQCYPQYYQMDESMGTHIMNYTGVANTSDASATACAASCNSDNTCIAATWVYTNTLSGDSADTAGKCYMVTPTGTGGTLAVKVLPMDFLSGASLKGKAAVASGAYVFWAHDYTTLLGVELATSTNGLQACKDLCDANSACVLFQHDGTTCALRTGLEAEGARTFMHIVGDKIDTA